MFGKPQSLDSCGRQCKLSIESGIEDNFDRKGLTVRGQYFDDNPCLQVIADCAGQHSSSGSLRPPKLMDAL